MSDRIPVDQAGLPGFRLEGRMMRYSIFMPRLYNFCRSLGFQPEHMLPSRAFCSDESQGYPVILIAKHFGTFPFNHGRAGGIVVTDRHGPHADHGEDLLILQASHVGYDADLHHFGTYRRERARNGQSSSNCGKVEFVLSWYEEQYHYARASIRVERVGSEWFVAIDNALLGDERGEGLFLNLDQFVDGAAQGAIKPVRALSTARVFRAAPGLAASFRDLSSGTMQPIGDRLYAEMFYFRRKIPEDVEGGTQLQRNLLPVMSSILTAHSPMLAAAQANTQREFDRAHRSMVQSPHYRGRNFLFLSGLNIDISPRPGQPFPLTKFVPWAAYVQPRDDAPYILEQDALWEVLSTQSTENPEQMDLEAAIAAMGAAAEIHLESD